RPLEAAHRRAPALELGVVEHEAALDPIEQGRRDRDEAFLGVALDDAADVRRQTEHLLHDDDPADGLAGRLGAISVELVSVLRGKPQILAHARSSDRPQTNAEAAAAPMPRPPRARRQSPSE